MYFKFSKSFCMVSTYYTYITYRVQLYISVHRNLIIQIVLSTWVLHFAVFSFAKKDANEMLQQLKILCTVYLRLFPCCSIKVTFFHDSCACMYSPLLDSFHEINIQAWICL